VNQSHRFWFTLSLALGQPVAVLQQQVDSREFTEWLVFNSIEPIGELREDIRTASLAHVVASMFAKNVPPVKDFLIDFWSSKGIRRMSGEEMFATFKRSARRK